MLHNDGNEGRKFANFLPWMEIRVPTLPLGQGNPSKKGNESRRVFGLIGARGNTKSPLSAKMRREEYHRIPRLRGSSCYQLCPKINTKLVGMEEALAWIIPAHHILERFSELSLSTISSIRSMVQINKQWELYEPNCRDRQLSKPLN